MSNDLDGALEAHKERYEAVLAAELALQDAQAELQATRLDLVNKLADELTQVPGLKERAKGLKHSEVAGDRDPLIYLVQAAEARFFEQSGRHLSHMEAQWALEEKRPPLKVMHVNSWHGAEAGVTCPECGFHIQGEALMNKHYTPTDGTVQTDVARSQRTLALGQSKDMQDFYEQEGVIPEEGETHE